MSVIQAGGRVLSFTVGIFPTGILFFSLFSHAQESAFKIEPTNQSATAASLPTPSTGTTQVGGSAKSTAAYYPSPIPGQTTLNQSMNGEVNFLLNSEGSLSRSKIDLTVGKYFDWGQSYLSVQQLYTGIAFDENHGQVSVGRRLEFWSEVDKDWQLGLWQPQFNTDPLQLVDQGLTGIFYQQSVGQFDWLLFASPIFIPTTGPQIQEQDGSLVSTSRWYTQPATKGTILGQSTQFVYSLDVPALSQLVNNPGSGLRLRWNEDQKKGLWASANYSYKPINTLQVKYNADLALSGNAQIDVVPVVAYAQLWGGDMGFNSDSYGSFAISYLEEDPVQSLPTDDSSTVDWWQQQPGSLHIYSAHWNSLLNVQPFMEKVDVAVDYLKVFQTITQDEDNTGFVHSAILPFQTLFTNALALKGKLATTLVGKRLISKFRVLRDFDQSGNLYGTEFDLSWTRRLTLNAGVDVISPDDPSANNQDPRFLNQFRANDRIYSGFNYVF